MSSTPQKNQSSHFENPYSEPGETPQKQLDNVEQVSSHVLRERNRHSDIFNREGAPETTEEAEPEPSKHIRSNDAENDSSAAKFRNRNSSSSVFGSDLGSPAAAQQQASPPSPTNTTPYKISNIF